MIGRFFRRRKSTPQTFRKELLALLADEDGNGRPTHCKFCDAKPLIIVYGGDQHAFLCDEHIASFFLLWTGRQTDFQVVKL